MWRRFLKRIGVLKLTQQDISNKVAKMPRFKAIYTTDQFKLGKGKVTRYRTKKSV